MPPKKLPPRAAKQQTTPDASKPKTTPQSQKPKPKQAANPQPIPEADIKQSSGMSATLALQAAKKAYELRQAAYGAGDANAREEILAKAINKEIEAESFGKAAKYTRSGAFQGLAAGAGLGVMPGATLGKITGAIVGGVVSSVGALLGGGIGSAYGAISGPFWDLGEMASKGVRGVVGDWPNWEATGSQKKALEKMVLGAQKTKAPDEDELQEMSQDCERGDAETYSKWASDLTSYIPGMPSMPSTSSLPSMPNMPSIPGFGGFGGSGKTAAKSGVSESAKERKPAESAKPGGKKQTEKEPQKQGEVMKERKAMESEKPAVTKQTRSTSTTVQEPEKKRPKKLEPRSSNAAPDKPAVKRAPKKLEPRKQVATKSS